MKALLRISVFTLIGFAGAAVNFFLLPILSHYLSPTDYGYTGLINSYVSLITPFISFISFAIIGVEYFKFKSREEFASLFSSVCVIPIVPAIMWLLVFYIGYNNFYTALELPAERWLSIAILTISFLTIYIEVTLAYLVISKNVKKFAVFTISKIAIETLLTILFVIVMKMGWKGRILSWLFTTILFSLASFYIFYKEQLLTRNIKKKHMKSAIVYGYPLIAHEMGKYAINQSDRLFIAKMVSVAEAGIYNIGYTVGSMIMIFANALSNYFNPIMMESLANINNENKKKLVKISYLFILIMIAAFICLNIVSPFLFTYLIDKSYTEGMSYVFWVSLSYLFWGVYLVFCGYLYFYHKTKTLAMFSIVNVVLNIILNYFFILSHGAIGAAYATCVSFLIVSILVIIKANTLIKLPWKYYLTFRSWRK